MQKRRNEAHSIKKQPLAFITEKLQEDPLRCNTRGRSETNTRSKRNVSTAKNRFGNVSTPRVLRNDLLQGRFAPMH